MGDGGGEPSEFFCSGIGYLSWLVKTVWWRVYLVREGECQRMGMSLVGDVHAAQKSSLFLGGRIAVEFTRSTSGTSTFALHVILTPPYLHRAGNLFVAFCGENGESVPFRGIRFLKTPSKLYSASCICVSLSVLSVSSHRQDAAFSSTWT